MEPTYDVRFAKSNDGINWDPQSMKPVIALENEEGGISSARVIKSSNNNFVMFFSVRNKINYRVNKADSYRIKSAHSTNELDWKRNDEILIDVSKEGWDDFMTCYPYVIDSVMFYNGNGFGKTGIGYALWV
jgi:sucrose-6-phosphate hydrolase SacC (GH32 family)